MKRFVLAATLMVAACGGNLPGIRPHAMPGSAAMSSFDRAYAEGKKGLLADRAGLAIVTFERAVVINPRSVAALNAIGTAYDLLHRPDVAKRYYSAALAIESASADTVNNMAVSASMAGNTALASELFSRAVTLDPGNPVIIRNLQSGARGQPSVRPTNVSAAFPDHRPQIVRSGMSEFTLIFASMDSSMAWPGLPGTLSMFGLQCVPFARALNGIMLRGDAVYWWEAATGVYARGSVPEVGSIISFRPISIMPLGHIAVVTDVVGPREVRIDHANWTHSDDLPDGISRGIAVIDVSERNDWSAVGVAIRRSRAFGNVYPVNGFIYNRPGEPHPIGKIPQMPRRVLEVMAAEGDGGLPVNVAFHSQR